VINPLNPRVQLHSPALGEASPRGRLLGRRIVVIGAGQRAADGDESAVGLGRAISLLFAHEGAQLACVDVSEASVSATVAQVEAQGGNAILEIADVREVEALKPMLKRCADRLGGFDGLVLNVGTSHGVPMGLIKPSAWDDEFAVNLRSHMLMAQAALFMMAPGSSIILMSSVAGLNAVSRNPAYEASKAGQLALARSIAVAGECRGIRCNAVLPGLIDTPMGRQASQKRPGRAAAVPFGRQGTAWEVAHACLFLMSHESSYVNGHSLVVDGGLSAGVMRPQRVNTSGSSA
jgi:NAD(P)-dependent dehydrogenase (short-subunit alcohol dehydrogenase family)